MAALTLGTRHSRLAQRQASLVIEALREAWRGLRVELRVFTTAGDRDRVHPLPEIGGKGVFTSEIEAALAQGEIDLAVHSLKDLPMTEGNCIADLCIGAVLPREDARDVVISRHGLPLGRLPSRPRIGTCSPRRAAQLLAIRPDAQIVPLRGNVDTRVRRAADEEYDAVVLAAAGIIRLGLQQRVTEWLSFEQMLPAPGQGALAVQCRAGDQQTVAWLHPLHHAATWAAVRAERAFLLALGGGCSAPVAAYAQQLSEAGHRSLLQLQGMVASPIPLACEGGKGDADGREGPRLPQLLRVAAAGQADEPEELGRRLAQEALDRGGRAFWERMPWPVG